MDFPIAFRLEQMVKAEVSFLTAIAAPSTAM